MNALTVATLALRITLILGSVGVINAARRRSSAGSRHWLWMLALVGVSVLPGAARITPPLRVVPWKSAEASAGPAPHFEAAPVKAGTAAAGYQLPDLNTEVAGNATLDDSSQSVAPSIDLATSIAIVWALGTLLLIGRLVRAHVVARRVVKNSYLTRQPNIESVPVRFSAEVELPFTYGLRNPVIVLPAEADSWDASHMKATLMHEAAHAKRGDGIALLVSQIIVAVYWWHPIVWIAARAAAADRERACDDAVLREGMRASDYGQCLLAHADTIAAWKSSPLATVMFGHSAGLGSRVAALLDPAIDRSSAARPKVLVVAGVFGLVALVGAAAPRTSENVSTGGRIGALTSSTGAAPAASAPEDRSGLVNASIIPVASFAPSSSDATVCRQAKNSRQARKYRDAAVQIQGAGGSFNGGVSREIWTGLDCIAWLQFSGQVDASSDEKNMIVGNNGRFIAHNEGPDGTREYTLTSTSSSLTLNGSTTAIGSAEQEWIAGMTQEFLRRTGKRIAERSQAATARGLPALLGEVARIPDTNVRAKYLTAGFAATHNAHAVAEFIHAGSELLDSLDSRAPFLTAVPSAYLNNPEVLEAIYSEASVIEPDGSLEEVVAKTDPARPLSGRLRPLMEKIIASIQTSERRAALSAYYLGTKP